MRNNCAFDVIEDVQLEHIGEDYCKYSFCDSDGERQEVEITGYAQAIINTLGLALMKKSFRDKLD